MVDNPLSPRRRQYGRGLNAGVQVYAMADRTPNSATDRAQNSFMYMLSDKPIHKFVKVIFREAVLEDFDPEDYPGAASEEELLKFVVPWTAGPPVVLGPQPAGEDPRSDAGLAVDRYPYTGSTDADDKNNLADATLFAFVGTATESKAQVPPILFEGTGAGVDLSDRSKFLSLGSAWSAARTIQANPMTGVGVGRISGTQGFVWDLEGAVVRDWRGEENGQQIYGSAQQFAPQGDFLVMGKLLAAERANDVWIYANPAAKQWRDAIVSALGGEVVEYPPAAGDNEDLLSDGADTGSRQSLVLPRRLTDYQFIEVEVKTAAGAQIGEVVDVSTEALVASGMQGASRAVGNEIIRLWSDPDSNSTLLYDLVAADGSVKVSTNTISIVGTGPIEDRVAAFAAYQTFLASEENIAAVRQLPLGCRINEAGLYVEPDGNSFSPGGISADKVLAVAAPQLIEEAWVALPEAYSCNPVMCLMDWIMDAGRPSGFKVDAATQLGFLEEMRDDADECDRLITIGRFVLQADRDDKDADGNFMHQSSYDFIGGRERDVDPQANKFVTISADGTVNEIAGGSFGDGIRYTGPTIDNNSAPTSGSGSFVHNGLTYEYRWRMTLEKAGEEKHGFLNLRRRDVFHPRWSVEMDRFNSDILIRNEIGNDAAPMPSSLELSERIANPLAAAACVLPVVFLSRTATDGTVSNISRRLEAAGFEFKPTRPGEPYSWEIPEGTLTITVTRLASGTLATTLAVAPSADYSAVVVTSAHLEVCARKYELNALLSFGDSERENMQRFEESVVGDIWDEGLALRFRVARWTDPVKTIRTADFAGQIQIARDEGGKAEDVTTGLQAEFLDVANAWRPAETQTLTDREALSQTDGVETTSRVTFPFANSRVRATAVGWQQLALERARRVVQISPLRFGFEALQRGDRVVLSMNEFGFADEIFQVRRVRPEKTGVTLLLREDREEWYSDEFWSTAVDETPVLFSGRRLLDEQGEALLDEQGKMLLVD